MNYLPLQHDTRASISLLLLYKLDFVLTKEKQTQFEPFNKFIKQN